MKSSSLASSLLGLLVAAVAAKPDCWIPPVSEAGAPLPPSYLSLSIEFQFFPNYTGNASHPNQFSLDLFKQFADAGDPPILRLGGSTQDRVEYDLSLPYSHEMQWVYGYESNPIRGKMGPSWYDGIDLLPDDFRYVFGVNMGGLNNTSGMHDWNLTRENIKRQATTAQEKIGKRLWAIEPGNEVAGFNHSYLGVWWRDPTQRWEAVHFQNDTNSTYEALQGPILPGKPDEDQSANPLWRGGDLAGFKVGWQYEDFFNAGINAYNRLREFSIHNYPKTVCDARLGAQVSIDNAMMDHSLISSALENFRRFAVDAASRGIEFVMGEGNSVSCQGKPAVSDSFSGAIWTFDYALYAATVGFKRIYYHQGPSFPYAAFWPTKYNGTEPAVRGSWYGLLLAQKAFGSTAKGTSGKRVAVMINEQRFSAYALYTSNKPQWGHQEWYSEKPAVDDGKNATWAATDLAFLNMQPFYQNSSQSTRGSRTIPVGKSWNGAKITRITAPGADTLPFTSGKAPYMESHEAEGVVSIGCMTYVSGKPERIENCQDEVVENGRVVIRDSEAILVSKA